MITKRLSLLLVYVSAALLLAIFITGQLFMNTHEQQAKLAQRADNATHQLMQTLPKFIAYYDTDSIKLIVNAMLSPELTSITLTDQITSEAASWSYDKMSADDVSSERILTDKMPTSSYWFSSLTQVAPVERVIELKNDDAVVASLALTLSAAKANQNVATRIASLLASASLLTLGLLCVFTLISEKHRRALRKATSTIRQLAVQDFSSQESSSQRSGLALLDSAIDSLAQQVQRLIQSLNNELKTLHNSMMYDAVSGLPNRQYFSHQLNSWMGEGHDAQSAVFIANMAWMDTIYRRYGYAARDETWRLLSNSLQSALGNQTNICIARISETEVALLLPEYSEEQSRHCLHTLISTLNNEVTMAGFDANEGFHIGVVHGHAVPSSQLMSLADNAMQRAIQINDVFVFNRGSEEQVIDRETWRSLLTDTLREKAIRLQWQPVNRLDSANSKPFHYEVFTQALIEHQWQSAGRIMPYIQLFSKGIEFDKIVIESLVGMHKLQSLETPIALNLTDESLSSEAFTNWLVQTLNTALPREKIFFEISEASARNNLKACISFSDKVRDAGAFVGVDHFGRFLQEVEYLAKLKPSYVKLDQAFSQEQNNQNRLFTETLANIADSLNITVIATGVKDEENKTRLNREFIDAYQGFIHPPVMIILKEQAV
ncbi:c-di-GMP receptor LapD [Enterovibrio norvegicus FF-454]|uniref:C-di-GMP receptor LapD n=1 Tax=Enterovibrio norvegicus FF-454 TaxID=1185651 RepID=A0A1E5BW98_9GAMM|nr:GGDEF domain-containing protein [Enterovibrio norvegicus]OEE57536.1 c-di-GMP receptor LapD [Enterovibrio norvegicus FF-454]